MHRPSPTSRPRALASTLLSVALIATASPLAAQSAADTTFTWSKQLAANTTLRIVNISGSIDVRPATGNRVEVRATKRLPSGRNPADVGFDVRERAGEVTICTTYRDENSCDDRGVRDFRGTVRYIVEVPRNLLLNVSTGNGTIDIAQAGADVRAATGNGRVTIGETDGSVTASTGNGDVEIESARGPVKVSTGNGRVFVMTASGPVNATTGNGDIDVRMKALSARGDMTFTSGSGTIRLTLPADFNGELDASTGNGDLRSDFELRVMGRLDPRHIRGTIGTGGGALVRLRTGNGRLEVRKG